MRKARWLPESRVLLIFACVLLMLLGLACSAERASEPEARAVEVVLLGDSITYGTTFPLEDRPYTDLLAAELAGTHVLRNAGCAGASTSDWTLSGGDHSCYPDVHESLIFDAVLRPLLPADWVVILLGTNDSIGAREPAVLSAQLYEQNLIEIMEQARAAGAGAFLLVTPPPRCEAAAMQALAGYREVLLSLCEARADTECGPNLLRLLDAQQDLSACNVHPNQRGTQKIAKALARRLRELSSQAP